MWSAMWKTSRNIWVNQKCAWEWFTQQICFGRILVLNLHEAISSITPIPAHQWYWFSRNRMNLDFKPVSMGRNVIPERNHTVYELPFHWRNVNIKKRTQNTCKPQCPSQAAGTQPALYVCLRWPIQVSLPTQLISIKILSSMTIIKTKTKGALCIKSNPCISTIHQSSHEHQETCRFPLFLFIAEMLRMWGGRRKTVVI